MSHLLLDGFLGFIGAFVGLLAAAAVLFWWGRRKLRQLRAQLATRVLSSDLSVRSVLSSLRFNRNEAATAGVRWRLRTEIDRCAVAVRSAERLGVAGDALGARSAELHVAAEALDAHLASVASVNVDPTLLAKADSLGAAARQLQAEASRRASEAAVPGLDDLTSSVAEEFAHPTLGGRSRRALGRPRPS